MYFIHRDGASLLKKLHANIVSHLGLMNLNPMYLSFNPTPISGHFSAVCKVLV